MAFINHEHTKLTAVIRGFTGARTGSNHSNLCECFALLSCSVFCSDCVSQHMKAGVLFKTDFTLLHRFFVRQKRHELWIIQKIRRTAGQFITAEQQKKPCVTGGTLVSFR